MGDILSGSTEQWKQAFEEGAHTSFKMVEVLMALTRVTYRDFLRNPAVLTSFQPEWVDDAFSPTYLGTWQSLTGRCTSFAIKVAYNLQRTYPGHLEFQYYDIGGHRIARCINTGILIDSESAVGAQMLPDNGAWANTPNDRRGRFRYFEGFSVFEEDRGDGGGRVGPITPEMALGICLDEIARKAVLVCLFRSIAEQEQEYDADDDADESSRAPAWRPEYHGVVRWRLAERRIELTPNLERREEFSSIIFGAPGASQATNLECAKNLMAFIRACGIEQQWKADGIDRFHKELWKAAVEVWGRPVWRTG